VSGNQTQDEIDQRFQGIGKAKVEPIHIETDNSAKATADCTAIQGTLQTTHGRVPTRR